MIHKGWETPSTSNLHTFHISYFQQHITLKTIIMFLSASHILSMWLNTVKTYFGKCFKFYSCWAFWICKRNPLWTVCWQIKKLNHSMKKSSGWGHLQNFVTMKLCHHKSWKFRRNTIMLNMCKRCGIFSLPFSHSNFWDMA